MNKDQFWRIVEDVRSSADPRDQGAFLFALQEQLRKLPSAEIIASSGYIIGKHLQVSHCLAVLFLSYESLQRTGVIPHIMTQKAGRLVCFLYQFYLMGIRFILLLKHFLLIA